MSKDQDDDYEVGYGKPPKSGMFKKGQSGNPKGKQKRVKNFRTEVNDMLATKVTVTAAGKPKLVGTTHAALMRLREKALKGDPRALNSLLGYAEENSNASEDRSRERKLNKLERDILDRSGLLGDDDDADDAADE
jgi:hypothetical protein